MAIGQLDDPADCRGFDQQLRDERFTFDVRDRVLRFVRNEVVSATGLARVRLES